MHLNALDHLAATVAAGLHDSQLGSDDLAAQAYDIAEALLRERALRHGGGSAALIEALPHDPSWEVEPRWSLADARAARLNELQGPGLARVGRQRSQDDSAADEATG